ncbi:MAG: T9SS type A sorting domain-containing protein, partial [Balneola sp.]
HAAGAWARAALTLREQSVSYHEPLYLPGSDQGKRSSEHQYPQAERPVTRVYPNPAQSTFKLELGELPLAENLVLTLYNLNGKAVKTLAVKARNTLIHLNDLPAGVYIVAVDADTKRIFEDKLVHID